jgi:4-diphosphocytidyl-2-C-methyl-D-erythritol kinase
MKQVTIEAPAKVNLGLDVIGRRTDGYHEIRSVMAMLDLSDRLVVFEDDSQANDDLPGVPGPDNLIRQALTRYRDIAPASAPLGWRIEKRIPAATGLGGASADAAAALFAANTLAGNPVPMDRLRLLAAEIGSDVPFFLGSPVAIASGRGTDLEPLPPVTGSVIVVVPEISLDAKTRSMYAALEPKDFGDGTVVDRVTDALVRGQIPASSSLRNSFSRAIGEKVPLLPVIWRALDNANIGPFALTGAGPATYVLLEGDVDRSEAVLRMKASLPPEVRIIATAFRGDPLFASPNDGTCLA